MKNRALVLLTAAVVGASFGAFAQAKAAKPAAKPAVKSSAKAAKPAAAKSNELSPEAVAAEKAFREAIAAGEPLTAENHFRKLVEANPNPSPELYWLAAETARQTGKGPVRRDRLQNFLRQSKQWNAQTEQAAWELCLSANDCDQYLRLCSHMEPSTKLFKIGLEMLSNYRRAKRSSDYLRITEGMLKAFKDEDARRTLIERMAEMNRDRAPGFDQEKAQKLAIDYPLKNMGSIGWTMDVTQDLFNQKWRMEFCSKNKRLLPAGQFNWATRIEYDPKKNPQGRALWALYAKDLEKLCLDGECDPSITLDWLNMRINLTDEFIPRVQTNKSSAALADCFLRAAKHVPAVDRGRLQQMLWDVMANRRLMRGEDLAELRRKAPDCLNSDLCTRWGGVCDLADKRTNAAPAMAFIRNNPKRFDVAWNSIGTLLKYGKDAENAKVLEILNEHVDRAGCFDGHAVMNTLSDKRFESKRLDFLRKAYERTGYNSTWGWLKNDKNNVNRWKWLKDDKNVATFVAAIDPKKTGSDKLLYLRGQMQALRRGNGNLAPEEAHKIMQQANAAYPGAYKKDGSRNSDNWYQIYLMYGELCRHNSDSAALMLTHLKGKMSKDMNWDPVNHALQHAWRAKNGALPNLEMTAERAAIFGDYGAFNDYGVPGEAIDKNTKQLSFKFDFAKTSAYTLKNFLWRNIRENRFPSELKVQLVGDFYRNYKPATFDPEWNVDLMNWVKGYCQKTNALCAKLPWEELAQHVLDRDLGRGDIARKFLYEMCWPAGKMEEMRGRYMEKMKTFDAPTYATEIVNLVNGGIVRDGLDKEGKTPDEMGGIWKDRVLPALRAVTAKDAPLVYFPNDWWFNRYGDYVGKKGKDNPEIQKLYADTCQEITRLLSCGARGYWCDDGRARYGVYGNVFDKAFAASNQVDMVKVAYELGRFYHNWNAGGANALAARLSDCKKYNRWQPLYLMVTGMTPGYGEGWVQTTCAKYRAEAATKLPGIYPVGEKDPAYPLYVAADEYNRNNLERAHELLMAKQNLATFEREAPNLPPDFVGWGIEQLRLERGTDDELLVKARNIATTLLMNEAKIPASLAAAAILCRAESYRDQQNFEAAKLEYQSIRNSQSYSATPSGRKAMFRSVDLMIDTGNISGAEQTIEYWLSQPEPEIQAQARYFLARIAFDRKDYPETIKQIRKVFEIDFTHTEARFLHGQWKLATNSEVDETDVLIGDLADRTVIRPGQQLTITVQDRNLSVAGGGASIPVVITTNPGADQERILLYPSARDPNLFKGVIDVKLGTAVNSNLVLEVRGNDVASYVIEPEFLKLRGLPLNSPKVLRVVDDAKLAIGTGAPRVEEKQVKKDVESALEGGDAKALASSLRPGNPLYVVVSDKDRSRGEGSFVNVEVKTSSGDRLPSLRLDEVEPFTGVFRGKVDTSLPPPRAYASDTSAGFNPGDVINSTKSGHWKSLMDSQPGKWIAVDTMASHLVSNAVIKMAAPEEIRSIRLVGQLGDDTMLLGQLPKQEAGRRAGFRRFETRSNRAYHSVRDLAALFEGSKAGRGMILTNIAFRSDFSRDRRPVETYFRGAFLQPVGHDFLRLRVNPEKVQGDTFRGLWIQINVDGKSIFQGQGPTVADKIIATKITPSVHLLEIYVTSTAGADGFDLLWEPYGEVARPVPMDWFDAEKHPMITEFLEDKAEIVRTKEGYVAKFKKPTRLRTLRWEFADRTGPGVEVFKLEVQDETGKMVIPSGADFSDAQQNDTLEVAPGDQISVNYVDERTSSGQKRILNRGINSSFNNAKVGFYFEAVKESDSGNRSYLYSAYRFMPGDNMLVCVDDPDCDVSEEADKVLVTVTTRSGGKKRLMLLEQSKGFANLGVQPDMEGVHTGRFMGLLRTALDTDENANPKALKVKKDDVLEISYEDRENTDPGVPFVRSTTVQSSRLTKPRLTLFDCTKQKVVDKSADAAARLAMIRRRPGNEQVKVLYADAISATPMDRGTIEGEDDIPVNVACPVIMRVNDPCRARHEASTIKVELMAGSELAAAEADGRDPEGVTVTLGVGSSFGGVKLTRGGESTDEAKAAGSFNGTLNLCLGQLDPNLEIREDAARPLSVTGSDTIRLRVLGEDGKVVIEKTLKLVSDASMGLMDSTWNAERNAAHVGERFFLRVEDADRDLSDQPDQIEAVVKALRSGAQRKIVLSETMPHSGVFTGMVRPVILGPGEIVPDVVTGGVVRAIDAASVTNEDRFAVRYGDNIMFTYVDENTLPGTPSPMSLCATGIVHRGANGMVRMFSKRFRDSDTGVLVQFRLAECLFEQAKEFRRLKQKERSAEVIAEGKFILEEALKNYPNSSHAMQGEFLLANLYQELANEQKELKNMDGARPLYTEALARFSTMLSIWPEGEYAARAQYHKAFCLEMLGDYPRSSEEYVKMTYLYPDSDLVGDATIRLANYYYKQEKRYDIAARIYENFQKRFPQHNKAARALFMSGACFVKQGEFLAEKAAKAKKRHGPVDVTSYYKRAVKSFTKMAEEYRETTTPDQRGQALYWAGDASLRAKDFPSSYLFLKRTVLEYPETEWARRARGLLLQEARTFKDMED